MSVEKLLLNPSETKLEKLNELIKREEVELNYIEDFIFNSYNAKLIYLCGKHIEWLNKERVAHTLAKTYDDYYILEYAFYINNLDIPLKMKKHLIKELFKGMSKCKNAINLYYFARDIKLSPIEAIAKALIKLDDSLVLYYFIRDLYAKLSSDIKMKIARKIIALRDSAKIMFVKELVPDVSIEEYAYGLLNSKPTYTFASDLCQFYSDCDDLDYELKNRILQAIIDSKDYLRICNFIKNNENIPYIKFIDSLLKEKENTSSSLFWTSYIIPLALCDKECSSYAVDKIIEYGDLEIITITACYMENVELKLRLQCALNKINNIDDKYKDLPLHYKVIERARKFPKSY